MSIGVWFFWPQDNLGNYFRVEFEAPVGHDTITCGAKFNGR